MTQQAQAQAAQAPAPGQWFDLPGVPGGASQWSEQDESTVASTIALSQTNAVVFQTINQFKQTDVVADWILNVNVTQTYTVGTSALTASAYAPWNAIGAVALSIQNQYSSLDVESGIDLYIFTLLRPYSYDAETNSGVNIYANPAGAPIGGTATGYQAAALAQPNLINAQQWTTGIASYNLLARIPAGQYFDNYFDLSIDGNVLTNGHPALVSPQYMAGTTRVISPKITMNAGSVATTDNGPVNIGAGTGTFAGSATARLRRKALYASQNTAILPSVYAWQYRQKTNRQGIGAVATKDLPVPLDSGQILALYVRLFDPAAAGGLGAPISLANLTRVNIQYGSGLYAFDAQSNGGLSAGAMLQRRWLQNHNSMLPAGVFAFDFALDERGQMSNKRCLNTLTTAGIIVHMDFSGVQSPSAYAVMGVESLVYVS